MCRLIAELTNTNQRITAEIIRRLEHKSANQNVDIKLTSDIHSQIHQKIRALGLDPHDTTNEELYNSLLNMAKMHDKFLRKKFDVKYDISNIEFAEDVVSVYEKLRINRRCWLVRKPVIRKILKDNPPKNLIKLLGYRTLESMVKREPVEVTMFLATKTEGKIWQSNFEASLKKLSAVDFEERLINIFSLTDKKYKKALNILVENHNSLIYGVPLIGSIMVVPPSKHNIPGLFTLKIIMALKTATELQFSNSHLRHFQMSGSFGKHVVDNFNGTNKKHVNVASHAFGWDIIHRHFGSIESKLHPDIFQPHLQPDDLAYRRSEEILYKIEPALHFWHGVEFVGIPLEDGVLSFNLVDILVNLVNNLNFENRHYAHIGPAVWDELLLRYLKHHNIETDLLAGLSKYDYANTSIMKDMEFA